jgi:hypothetical protein
MERDINDDMDRSLFFIVRGLHFSALQIERLSTRAASAGLGRCIMEQLVVPFIQCSCNQVHGLDDGRKKILHISSRLPGAISSPSATCAANPGSSMHLNSILCILCRWFVFFFQRGAETMNPCPAARL